MVRKTRRAVSKTPTVASVTLASAFLLGAHDAKPQDSAPVLEEVIVFANKRSESLQEISSSVTALSGEFVDRTNIREFGQIADFTPGMQQPTPGQITIRGIGRQNAGVEFASTVAVHENGFFLPYPPVFQMVDIASVEITRGPSGTVFGRNATAGAINTKWRAPESDWGFGLDALVASDDEQLIRGYLNAPLLDQDRLNARGAFFIHEKDGTIDSELSPSDLDGENRDDWMGRVFLTSNLTDNISLAYRYMKARKDNTYYYGVPDEESRESGILEALGSPAPLPDDLYRIRSDIIQKSDGATGWQDVIRHEVEMEFNLPELPLFGETSFFVMAGEQNFDGRRISDLDGTESDIVFQDINQDSEVRNAEARWSSADHSEISWMLGLFWAEFEDDEAPTKAIATLPVVPGTTEPTLRAVLTDSVNERDNESKAVFFSATAHLGEIVDDFPDIDLFGGYRINEDDVATAQNRNRQVFIPPDSPEEVEFLNTTTNVEASDDFDENTWELGIKWFASDQHMLYAKAAKGYKSGAVETTSGALNSVDPETLHAFEIGAKSSFFNRSMTVNIAAFYYDYDDLQVLYRENLETRTDNAAAATSQGLELEMTWQPTEALQTMLAVSWLDAEFDDYCSTDPTFPQGSIDPGCVDQGGERDLSGEQLPYSPELTATAVASYTLSLGDSGSLTGTLKSTYTDDQYIAPSNLARYEVDSYTKTDARLRWTSPTQRYEVEAFVENIEDDRDIFLSPVATGIEDTLFLFSEVPPRTSGMRFRFNY